MFSISSIQHACNARSKILQCFRSGICNATRPAYVMQNNQEMECMAIPDVQCERTPDMHCMATPEMQCMATPDVQCTGNQLCTAQASGWCNARAASHALHNTGAQCCQNGPCCNACLSTAPRNIAMFRLMRHTQNPMVQPACSAPDRG